MIEAPVDSRLRIAVGLAGLQFGGCQINAIDLARTLRERGHVLTIFAVRDDSIQLTILPYAARSGFEVQILENRAGGWGTAHEISILVREHECDLVHVFAPWLNRPAAIASAMRIRQATIETNWNMENSFCGSSIVPLIVGTGKMFDEAASVRRGAVHLIEPPVDLDVDFPDQAGGDEYRAHLGIPNHHTLAVVVSRVDHDMKLEGILNAIAAVELLDLPDLTLVIVGDGDAIGTVREAASATNHCLGRSVIRVVGALQDPRPAYDAADIVLGMGGAAIRGLAHGKALIVLGERGFSMPYTPATVDHFRWEGFYGLGASQGPVAQLAGHIELLKDDPKWREKLANFGISEVRARFGLNAAADFLETAYRDAIHNAPGRTIRVAVASLLIARMLLSRMRSRLYGSCR